MELDYATLFATSSQRHAVYQQLSGIEQMNDTTLLSVSQACAQGFVGIFTSKVCKFYNAKDVIPHLQDISQNANPVMSGKVEDGLDLLDSN